MQRFTHEISQKRKAVMKYYFLGLFFAFAIFSSCKKNNAETYNVIVFNGQWKWVNSGFGDNYLVTQASGVEKTVVFNNGTVLITHNDSTSNSDFLTVSPQPVLLNKPVTDTSTYSIITASTGCVNMQYTYLKISSYSEFEYTISNDTLRIFPGPCLAPYTTTFVKVH